ncbi:MAG: hypothetical protein HQM08_20295 [Candidatus Riflebacteria bacterium]|nr:hypothetical protein [Candidatus Riflebacteria bacterium]
MNFFKENRTSLLQSPSWDANSPGTPGMVGCGEFLCGSHCLKKSIKHSGFSFFELLISLVVLASAVGFLFSLFSSSTQGTLDSFHETIAYTLAGESLELVTGLGYETLAAWCADPSSIPSPNDLGISIRPPGTTGGNEPFQSVEKVSLDNPPEVIAYPDEYKLFERRVAIQKIPNKALVYVETTVRVKTGLWRKGQVTLGRLIGTEYLKW